MDIKVTSNPSPNLIKYHAEQMNSLLCSSLPCSPSDLKSECIFIYLENTPEHYLGCLKLQILLDYAIIEDIWVDSDYQNQGWALKLILNAEQLLKTKSVQTLLLNTFDKIRAVPFWEKMGFSIAGTVPNCPRDLNLYYMYKKIF